MRQSATARHDFPAEILRRILAEAGADDGLLDDLAEVRGAPIESGDTAGRA